MASTTQFFLMIKGKMKAEEFYPLMHEASTQRPDERYTQLASIHVDFTRSYQRAVRKIDSQRAAMTSSDGRSIAQVVGHILEWERYTLQSMGEIISGVTWPRIMSGKGYLDVEGNEHVLKGDDAFNAFQAQRQKELPWASIQSEAIVLSGRLLQLFSGCGMITPEVLDNTRKFHWKYPDGIEISLPCGWFLWMVSLEHEAVEHSADLGIL